MRMTLGPLALLLLLLLYLIATRMPTVPTVRFLHLSSLALVQCVRVCGGGFSWPHPIAECQPWWQVGDNEIPCGKYWRKHSSREKEWEHTAAFGYLALPVESCQILVQTTNAFVTTKRNCVNELSEIARVIASYFVAVRFSQLTGISTPLDNENAGVKINDEFLNTVV
jgi:hypothetical protein